MVTELEGTESILFAEKPDIVPFSFGRETIDQGNLAQLTCVISSGDMPLTITWSLKGDLISFDNVNYNDWESNEHVGHSICGLSA